MQTISRQSNNVLRTVISILLAFVLMVGQLPALAYANTTNEQAVTQQEDTAATSSSKTDSSDSSSPDDTSVSSGGVSEEPESTSTSEGDSEQTSAEDENNSATLDTSKSAETSKGDINPEISLNNSNAINDSQTQTDTYTHTYSDTNAGISLTLNATGMTGMMMQAYEPMLSLTGSAEKEGDRIDQARAALEAAGLESPEIEGVYSFGWGAPTGAVTSTTQFPEGTSAFSASIPASEGMTVYLVRGTVGGGVTATPVDAEISNGVAIVNLWTMDSAPDSSLLTELYNVACNCDGGTPGYEQSDSTKIAYYAVGKKGQTQTDTYTHTYSDTNAGISLTLNATGMTGMMMQAYEPMLSLTGSAEKEGDRIDQARAALEAAGLESPEIEGVYSFGWGAPTGAVTSTTQFPEGTSAFSASIPASEGMTVYLVRGTVGGGVTATPVDAEISNGVAIVNLWTMDSAPDSSLLTELYNVACNCDGGTPGYEQSDSTKIAYYAVGKKGQTQTDIPSVPMGIPYSSLSGDLAPGEYTVTANLVIKGEDNQVLQGVNVAILSDAFPPTASNPALNNARLTVEEDGTMLLHVELYNGPSDIITLQNIASGSNLEVVDIKRGTTAGHESGYGVEGENSYSPDRILEVDFKLLDKSGWYIPSDCQELNCIAPPGTDISFKDMPIYLVVDFNSAVSNSESWSKSFVDDATGVSITVNTTSNALADELENASLVATKNSDEVTYAAIRNQLGGKLYVDNPAFDVWRVQLVNWMGVAIDLDSSAKVSLQLPTDYVMPEIYQYSADSISEMIDSTLGDHSVEFESSSLGDFVLVDGSSSYRWQHFEITDVNGSDSHYLLDVSTKADSMSTSMVSS